MQLLVLRRLSGMMRLVLCCLGVLAFCAVGSRAIAPKFSEAVTFQVCPVFHCGWCQLIARALLRRPGHHGAGGTKE